MRQPRGLHVDAFNRRYAEWLKTQLGDSFKTAVGASGGHARLEMDGPSLLRSICKLAYEGQNAYVKGDGKLIRDWLAEHYPSLSNKPIGRYELASRQDWCLEVSEKILPLCNPLLEYLVGTLVLDPNVLRDSALQRLELNHLQACVHACAILWVTAYQSRA